MTSATLKYGERQAAGQLLQQWMERPESDTSVAACPVQSSKLQLKDLRKSKEFEIDVEMNPYIPAQIEDEFEQLNIAGPRSGAWEMISIGEPDVTDDVEYPDLHIWEGQIAPGVLIVEEMKKTPSLFMSEVCQAVYENHFSMDTLKYVYMVDVCNRDTLSFVRDVLYTEANGLVWPDEEIHDWQLGTPEFEALLGTKIGKTVAHLVLGAFRRGTHRISQIRSFHTFEILQLRFTIEEMEHVTPVIPSVELPIRTVSTRVTRSMTRKRKAEEEETAAKKAQKKG
ncbi:hypothetical protein N7530_003687 [Penicillium desertorum]|uniref:Uncharacterized protein n=1 Tax=Penicillium desertorum TaxID=1303715 RepID=A0A9X0BPT2_9EURO|nr:hypothetical protein N7530_003687 [Penicillium desertorum]